MPLRGPCVHPGGGRSDPAWKSWAAMRSGCVASTGTPAQRGAAAAGSGHGSPRAVGQTSLRSPGPAVEGLWGSCAHLCHGSGWKDAADTSLPRDIISVSGTSEPAARSISASIPASPGLPAGSSGRDVQPGARVEALC